MRNQSLGSLLDIVIAIMEKEKCRLYDSDIMLALHNTTYDVVHGEIVNIRVDLSKNYKY